MSYQIGSQENATVVNGFEFWLEGAEYNLNPTWNGLAQRGYIYAWKVTDYYGKTEIAVWQPDLVNQDKFDITQQRIPYCQKNLEGLRNGKIMLGEQEVVF